ncbi:uncharacterized protein LOC143022692 [Oratosquilla oratoria]|uniref:uncharacterized protein LOC143022692 n=1 Tax=Oratosquilla oratoria TaxID=337810 RepID=UPI003F774C0D
MQWNCRAINTAWDLLVQHLARNSYEVIALQSLRKRPSQLPTLPGYHYPPFYKTDEAGEARVATYVALGLAAQPGQLTGISLEEGYGVVTSVSVEGDRTIHIFNVYNPVPSQHFTWLQDIPENWVVVGDFNRRDALWDSNYAHTSPTITSQLDAADMILLNDGSHTRLPDVAGHSKTAIDLSFVSSNLAGATDWFTLNDPMSSDHLPISITIHLSPTLHLPPAQEKLNLSRADWKAFQAFLVNFQCHHDPNSTIEDLNARFTDTVLAAASHAIPQVRTGNGRRGHPWWTDDCQNAVRNKRRAYQRYLREGTEEAFTDMKRTKAECKRTIARAKTKLLEEQRGRQRRPHCSLEEVQDYEDALQPSK